MAIDPPLYTPQLLPDDQWDDLFNQLCEPSTETRSTTQITPEVVAETHYIEQKAEIAPSPEEYHIEQLNLFLSQSIGEFLQNRLVDNALNAFTDALQKHLEPCKKILNPPASLQFFRHLAAELSANKNFFEISYSDNAAASKLPIPASISWIANNPVRVTIANPALRALLAGSLIANDHEEYYKTLITHVIKTVSIDTPESLNASHTLILRQMQFEYHYTLSFQQIILLFFPSFFAQIAHNFSEHDFSSFMDALFVEYPFGIRDVRFDGMLCDKTLVIESLIVGDVLLLFPPHLMQQSPQREKFKSYLSLLIHHGITDTRPMLSDETLSSIFTLASHILSNSQDSSSDSLLHNYVYDAFALLSRKKPMLVSQLQQCCRSLPAEKHETYVRFIIKRATFFQGMHNRSFLLRHLLRPTVQSAPNCAPILLKRKEEPLFREPKKRHTEPRDLAQQIEEFTSLCSKDFRQFSGSLRKLPKGEVIAQAYWSHDGKSMLGAALLKAMITHKRGIHLVVVPSNYEVMIRAYLLNTFFYPGMFHAWNIEIRQHNTIEAIKCFTSHFEKHFGNDHFYDIALLRCTRLFNPTLLFTNLNWSKYSQQKIGDRLLLHLTQLWSDCLLPSERETVRTTILSTLQCVQYIDRESDQIELITQVNAMCAEYQKKTNFSVSDIFSLIDTFYKSSTPIDRSRFLMASLLAGVQKKPVQLGDVERYPRTELLMRLMYFTPDQLMMGTNAEETQELIQKFPLFLDKHVVCVISPELLNVSLLHPDLPVVSLTAYEPNLYRQAQPVLDSLKSLIRIDHQRRSNPSENPPFFLSIVDNDSIWKPKPVIPLHTKPPIIAKIVPQAAMLPININLPIQGFVNIYNSCFINAGLQALFSLQAFQRLLQTPLLLPEDHPSRFLQCNLSELAKLHQTKDDLKKPLESVLKQLFEIVPDIKGKWGAFHDVVPVLEEILDRVGYALQCDITYHGLGDFKHLSSTERKPLFVLPVPMEKNAPFQTLIDRAVSVEEVNDGVNIWTATGDKNEKIPVAHFTTQHTLIEALPAFFVIQLKRWTWDKGSPVKDSNPIDFASDMPISIGSSRYLLKACIHQHHELLHYTADVCINSSWYRCDDKSIEALAKPDPATAYVYLVEKIG